MRLIDADKLKSELFDADWMMDNDEHMVEKIVERQPTVDAEPFITGETSDEAPSVDAEPVIHAKWIEDGYYGKPSVCSHCGEEAFYTSTFRELFDYDWDENLISLGSEEDREYVLTKWCPNCGAKMDGDADSADS